MLATSPFRFATGRVDSMVVKHWLCILQDLSLIPRGRIEGGEAVAYQLEHALSGEVGDSCNSRDGEPDLLVIWWGLDYGQIWEAVIALRAMCNLVGLARGDLPRGYCYLRHHRVSKVDASSLHQDLPYASNKQDSRRPPPTSTDERRH